MASAFGHAIMGYTISKLGKTSSRLLMGIAIVTSIFPDADIILHNMGVNYDSPFGHRGFTHSIFFALIWSGFMLLIFKKIRHWASYLIIFFSAISHGLIDAMTTGGKGIGFFIPFLNDRFFLPDFMRCIKVSPMSIERFFNNPERAFKILLSEFYWIFIPCIIVLILMKIFGYGNK